jgi:hypothetical protein
MRKMHVERAAAFGALRPLCRAQRNPRCVLAQTVFRQKVERRVKVCRKLKSEPRFHCVADLRASKAVWFEFVVDACGQLPKTCRKLQRRHARRVRRAGKQCLRLKKPRARRACMKRLHRARPVWRKRLRKACNKPAGAKCRASKQTYQKRVIRGMRKCLKVTDAAERSECRDALDTQRLTLYDLVISNCYAKRGSCAFERSRFQRRVAIARGRCFELVGWRHHRRAGTRWC